MRLSPVPLRCPALRLLVILTIIINPRGALCNNTMKTKKTILAMAAIVLASSVALIASTPFDEDLEVKDLKKAPPMETSYINVNPTDTYRGHGYVDLGLSVYWATINVGEKKGDSGNVLGWGEVSGPKGGDYCEANSNTIDRARGDISGDKNYDIAAKLWGGKWRMPTKKEMEELRTQCTWMWITSPITGYKITSKKNGNSIYLPAWGRFVGTRGIEYHLTGFYWTSTPCGNYKSAYRLSFRKEGTNLLEGLRSEGCNIRPVFSK